MHGRVREAKGRLAGLADWTKISQVVQRISPSVPVIANGGLPSAEELEPCLAETGASALMSAEGNLYNPMIFNPLNAQGGREYRQCLPAAMRVALDECDKRIGGEGQGQWPDDAAYAPSTFLASQYLAIVRTLPSTQTASSAIKAHLFKLFRPVWSAGHHLELREMLGRAGGGKLSSVERAAQYQAFVDKMEEAIRADLETGRLPAGSLRPLTHAEVVAKFDKVIPYSHAQPYLRVPQVDGATTIAEIADPAKRPHADVASSPKAEAADTVDSTHKRLRIDDKTGAPVDVVQPCSGPDCRDGASAKCPKGACKAHCGSLPNENGELGLCEFHADKLLKDEARKAEKAAVRKAAAEEKKVRKQQGGKGGKGNKQGAAGVLVTQPEVAVSEGVEVEVEGGAEHK